MNHTALVAPGTALLVLLASACAHDNGASTTTVTGGSPEGVRVTNVTATDEPAIRLADELCAHEAACNHIRDDGRYGSEKACMADQGASALAQLARWGCAPTRTHAGFEECLAAVRSERCEASLPRLDGLSACRSAAVCAADQP